jgi:hypothetical protein
MLPAPLQCLCICTRRQRLAPAPRACARATRHITAGHWRIVADCAAACEFKAPNWGLFLPLFGGMAQIWN